MDNSPIKLADLVVALRAWGTNKDRYACVTELAKWYLDEVYEGPALATMELKDRLWSILGAPDDIDPSFHRRFNVSLRKAPGLKAYRANTGPEVEAYGKTFRLLQWRRPSAVDALRAAAPEGWVKSEQEVKEAEATVNTVDKDSGLSNKPFPGSMPVECHCCRGSGKLYMKRKTD